MMMCADVRGTPATCIVMPSPSLPLSLVDDWTSIASNNQVLRRYAPSVDLLFWRDGDVFILKYVQDW